MHLHPGMDCAEQPEMYKVAQKNDTYCFAAKIGCRGPILLFHGCFGTRISSPIQLATIHYTLSESEMAQIFKLSFDNESIQSSVLAFLSPFRF